MLYDTLNEVGGIFDNLANMYPPLAAINSVLSPPPKQTPKEKPAPRSVTKIQKIVRPFKPESKTIQYVGIGLGALGLVTAIASFSIRGKR